MYACALYFGLMYDMYGLKNTAITFFVLYCMQKNCEFHFEARINGCVYVFYLCIFLYFVAVWLNNHPEFVVSIFDEIRP